LFAASVLSVFANVLSLSAAALNANSRTDAPAALRNQFRLKLLEAVTQTTLNF